MKKKCYAPGKMLQVSHWLPLAKVLLISNENKNIHRATFSQYIGCPDKIFITVLLSRLYIKNTVNYNSSIAYSTLIKLFPTLFRNKMSNLNSSLMVQLTEDLLKKQIDELRLFLHTEAIFLRH